MHRIPMHAGLPSVMWGRVDACRGESRQWIYCFTADGSTPMGPPKFLMWIQFGHDAGLTLMGFLTGVAINRTHCELRQPSMKQHQHCRCPAGTHDLTPRRRATMVNAGVRGTQLLTDGVCVARAEQAVGAQAVYSARRHFDKVEALSVVATVDDLQPLKHEDCTSSTGGRNVRCGT